MEERRRREERRAAELAAIREVHARLLAGDERGALVRRVLRAAREAAGSRRAVAALLDPGGEVLRARWGEGDVTPAFLEAFLFPLAAGGVLTAVVRRGETIHVFDAALPYFARLLAREEARVLDAPCFAALPLRRGAEAVGVLYADRDRHDEPFSDEEMETLGTLADLVSLALGEDRG